MKKIAIIGGGIVGASAAYYLSRAGIKVDLYDHGIGQASKAAAGIICPWLSLRRNKAWYYLVQQGAEFYVQFMTDLQNDGYDTDLIYQIDGAILIRHTDQRIEKDLQLAKEKQQLSPAMGQVKRLKPEEVNDLFPPLNIDRDVTWVTGGGRVHGELLMKTLYQAIQKLGGRLHIGKAGLRSTDQQAVVEWQGQAYHYDHILLSPGPGLATLLTPLGYQVDIRPQKGQLIVFQHEDWQQAHWPVVMPSGQADIIPFNHGEIIVGASHEDQVPFNLEPDMTILNQFKTEAQAWLPSLLDRPFHKYKIGVRAHTSDYSVIVGQVPHMKNAWAISGLGSSGLTSGPFLGFQWSQLMLQNHWDINPDMFPIEQYIQLKNN